jgi:hypothetical protein
MNNAREKLGVRNFAWKTQQNQAFIKIKEKEKANEIKVRTER